MSVRDKEFVEPLEVISEGKVLNDYDSNNVDAGSVSHQSIIDRMAFRLPGISRLMMSKSSVQSSAPESQQNSIRKNSSGLFSQLMINHTDFHDRKNGATPRNSSRHEMRYDEGPNHCSESSCSDHDHEDGVCDT